MILLFYNCHSVVPNLSWSLFTLIFAVFDCSEKFQFIISSLALIFILTCCINMKLNITLTLNYIQRSDYWWASINAILYHYSDTIFAIRRFNNAKDGNAFLFLPDCNMCVSHIRYLFIFSEVRSMTSVTITPWPTKQSSNFAAIQLKRTNTIENYTLYNDEYEYPLVSFLCHNLFVELESHFIRSVAMFCMPV